MRPSRWSTMLAAGALVVLASLGCVLVEDAFFHTDDGCAVEIHCLACRVALSGTVVPSARLCVKPVLAAAGVVAPRPTPSRIAPSPRGPLSRGPPAQAAPAS